VVQSLVGLKFPDSITQKLNKIDIFIYLKKKINTLVLLIYGFPNLIVGKIGSLKGAYSEVFKIF